jgi:hypothetical protein
VYCIAYKIKYVDHSTTRFAACPRHQRSGLTEKDRIGFFSVIVYVQSKEGQTHAWLPRAKRAGNPRTPYWESIGLVS